MWCHDPDRAFDVRCRNLGCEDWCKDYFNCPIQRKDQKMFISIKKNLELIKEMDSSEVVIQISKDRKRFHVLKHNDFKDSECEEYHISELHHILLAGK